MPCAGTITDDDWRPADGPQQLLYGGSAGGAMATAFDFMPAEPVEKPLDLRPHEAINPAEWREKIAREWHRWRLLP